MIAFRAARSTQSASGKLSKLSLQLPATVFLALCAMAAKPACAAPGDTWPVYQGNREHTGYVARTLLPQHGSARWSKQSVSSAGPSGLAIADGLVFTTPLGFKVMVAQSLADGHTVWSHDFGFVASVNQPAIDNGYLYLQTSDSYNATYIHKFRTDGTLLWRAPFLSQWEQYLGPIVVDGTVYFEGGYYGGVYSFNAYDGFMNWFTQLPQYDHWSPTWNDGLLVTYTNRLDVITASTGLDIITIPDPGWVGGYDVNQAPVVLGNRAYVINGGRLVAFDMQAQVIEWTRAISATGQVAVDGKQVFVIAGNGLSVRDPATGDLVWDWTPPPPGSLATNLIVSDSHVIVGDAANTYLVNRDTHQSDMTYPASGLLAYAADLLVVADAQGVVHTFNLPTDELFHAGFE